MKKDKNNSNENMRDEYDFSGAIRGKYAYRLLEQEGFYKLDPDLAKTFKNSSEVNHALRSLISAIPKNKRKVSVV
jgi:hypothetical protein